jgi:hypothetical protein
LVKGFSFVDFNLLRLVRSVKIPSNLGSQASTSTITLQVRRSDGDC